jgi:hypothetical protein
MKPFLIFAVLALSIAGVSSARAGSSFYQSAAVKVDEKTLQSYVGTYELKPSVVMEVSLEEGNLRLKVPGQEKATLVATSQTDFSVKDIQGMGVTFKVDDKGIVTGMTVHQNGDHNARKISSAVTAAAKFDANNLDIYVGQYEVQPGFLVTITNENGKLMGQPNGDDKVELKHEGEMKFSSDAVGALLTFVTGDSGEIVSMTINYGGQTYQAKKIK